VRAPRASLHSCSVNCMDPKPAAQLTLGWPCTEVCLQAKLQDAGRPCGAQANVLGRPEPVHGFQPLAITQQLTCKGYAAWIVSNTDVQCSLGCLLPAACHYQNRYGDPSVVCAVRLRCKCDLACSVGARYELSGGCIVCDDVLGRWQHFKKDASQHGPGRVCARGCAAAGGCRPGAAWRWGVGQRILLFVE